jgi:hypothetical protein
MSTMADRHVGSTPNQADSFVADCSAISWQIATDDVQRFPIEALCQDYREASLKMSRFFAVSGKPRLQGEKETCKQTRHKHSRNKCFRNTMCIRRRRKRD